MCVAVKKEKQKKYQFLHFIIFIYIISYQNGDNLNNTHPIPLIAFPTLADT